MSEDFIDRVAGITPGSPPDLLRRQRPEVRNNLQRLFDLLISGEEGGLSADERREAALVSARGGGHAGLIAAYESLVAEPDPTARREAISRHADALTRNPGAAQKADIDRLSETGLTPREIVLLTQIIGLVSFQTRLLAGLEALFAKDAA